MLASISIRMEEIPDVVMVGAHGSGKSTLTNALVGHCIVPKASTRGPITLHSMHVPIQDDSMQAPGGFSLPDSWFELVNYEELKCTAEDVHRVIEASGSRPTHIVCYVQDPFPLTIIDLPGLTLLSGGDQESPEGIRELVLSHIKSNSIILAVTPGNVDLANSDGLRLARQVDPERTRTIGIISKADLIEDQQALNNILDNKVYHLEHGFYAFTDRSRDTSVQRAAITKLAHSMIRKRIANVKAQLETSLSLKCQQCCLQRIHEPRSELLRLVVEFSESFKSTLDGKSFGDSASLASDLYAIYQDILPRDLDSLPLNLSIPEIKMAMRVSSGPAPAIFMSDACFELLVRKQLSLLCTPVMRCAALVRDAVQSHVSELSRSLLSDYPNLIGHVSRLVLSTITDYLYPDTIKHLQTTLDAESAYINTGHPDFCRSTSIAFGILSKLVQPRSQSYEEIPLQSIEEGQSEVGFFGWFKRKPTKSPPTFFTHTTRRRLNKEELEAQLLSALLTSYLSIIKKNLQDSTPKAIMHLFVRKLSDSLTAFLIDNLMKLDCEYMMQKDKEIIDKGARLLKEIETGQAALMLCNKLVD